MASSLSTEIQEYSFVILSRATPYTPIMKSHSAKPRNKPFPTKKTTMASKVIIKKKTARIQHQNYGSNDKILPVRYPSFSVDLWQRGHIQWQRWRWTSNCCKDHRRLKTYEILHLGKTSSNHLHPRLSTNFGTRASLQDFRLPIHHLSEQRNSSSFPAGMQKKCIDPNRLAHIENGLLKQAHICVSRCAGGQMEKTWTNICE